MVQTSHTHGSPTKNTGSCAGQVRIFEGIRDHIVL